MSFVIGFLSTQIIKSNIMALGAVMAIKIRKMSVLKTQIRIFLFSFFCVYSVSIDR